MRSVREAARNLARSPGYTVTALASVGGAIGLACSVYAVIAATFFAAPPYEAPDRLVEFWQTSGPGSSQPLDYLQPTRMQEWVEEQQSFRALEQVAATGLGPTLILRGTDGAVKVSSAPILGDWFGTLGVQPARGRLLGPDDLVPGATPAAVVSDAFWRNQMSEGDLGSITLSGTSYAVVGVMDPSFDASETVWLPVASLPSGFRPAAYAGVARLRVGATAEEARVEVERRAALQVQADSGYYSGRGATARPLGELGGSANRAQLWTVAGVVLAVLLVALNNLTVLTLVRAQSRNTALAIRASLGASRWELGRGLALEGALVGLAGAVVGLSSSHWGKDWAASFLGGQQIRPTLGIDVVMLAIGLATLVAVIVGVEPVRRLGSLDLQELLQRRSGGANTSPRERRSRQILLSVQIAACVVLVAAATLLGRAYQTLAGLDVGFDAEEVVEVFPDWEVAALGAEEQWRLAELFVARFESSPTIRHATAWRMVGEDYPPRPEFHAVTDGPSLELSPFDQLGRYYEVGQDFFAALGIELVRGRSFTPGDGRLGAPVAIVTERAAGLWWPDADPIGRRVKLGQAGAWMTIVGVVPDLQQLDALGRAVAIRDRPPMPLLFIPAGQFETPPLGWRTFDCCAGVRIGARPAGSAGAAIRAVRGVIAQEAPDLPLVSLGSLFDVQMDGYVGARIAMTRALVGSGVVVALALALIGMVGVVVEAIGRRTREIGVRVALGARAHQVSGTIAGEGVRATLLGLLLGLAALVALHGWAAGTVFDPYLQQLAPSVLSWRVLGTAAIVVLAVALAAILLTARRALRLDPVAALRAD